MKLNIGIIIKGFLAISITLLIVIGIIRTSNNLFYVESINPPSKEELFANIDFIDESCERLRRTFKCFWNQFR